ncbi:hypothetical protein QUA54_18600 [Microcoleus sp. MOSTC5]|uniref:hypothetical protein n=1 Tax=Microcoleus sp. MOSTC5 TaxID=3055378 RepID=UPI002FD38748
MKITPDTFLDLLATVFGTIGGVAQLLVVTNRINSDDGLLIGGLATIALGIVANKGKSPYTNSLRKPPNYFPIDFAPYDSPPYNDPYYEPPTEAPLKTHDYPTANTTQYNSKYKGQDSSKHPRKQQPENDRLQNDSESGRESFRPQRRTRKRLKPESSSIFPDASEPSK